MPLIAASSANWKKRRTLTYIDTNGKTHNVVQTQAPSAGAATFKVFERLGTTARVLSGIASATTINGTNVYQLRQD
jgi:hypothetical protein